MSQEPVDSGTPSSLYGQEPASAPSGPELTVMDCLVGIFTEPAATFQKLRSRPSWLGAGLLLTCLMLAMSLIWVMKLDPMAMVQNQMETMDRLMRSFGSQGIPSQVMDQALEKASRPWLGALLGSVAGLWFTLTVVALIVWGCARLGSVIEDEPATFKQAFSVTTVHYLAMALTYVATLAVMAIRPVGGQTLMALHPLTLGFFIHPDNPLVKGVMVGLMDPVYLFSWVLLGLGMKHTLRAKTWAIALAMIVLALVAVPMRIMGGIY